MAHILVVDDEADVVDAITQVLEESQYQVTSATNGPAALDLLARANPDLIVLDILMPDMDGIEVCRRIRADPFMGRVPIVFLTAKGRSQDIAKALDSGGDDYLVKPFDVIELPARIRALLRRVPGGPLDPGASELVIGRLRLQLTRTEAEIDGRSIHLTPTEHRLLHYLMQHAGQPIPIEQLLEDVWEYPPGVGDPKLPRVHITNLRAKLALTTEDPEYIQNVHGRGYFISD